jgi:hypothetical protein
VTEIDTINSQFVGIASGLPDGWSSPVVMVQRPSAAMSPDAALRHAAWLVAVAEHHATHPFADVLKAVRST